MKNTPEKIVRFIETSNCFEVMGQFRRLGLLSRADLEKAMRMTRAEWLGLMKEKAGVAQWQGGNGHVEEKKQDGQEETRSKT